MNKIYKLVWSKVRNTWVVVSEIAKGHGKSSSSEGSGKRLKSLVVMALLGCFVTAGGAVAIANGKESTVYGGGVASGLQSVAIGAKSKAEKQFSTAVGYQADAKEDDSTAYGYKAIATGLSSTALGNGAEAKEKWSTAVGSLAHAYEVYSTAVGSVAEATGQDSTAVGSVAEATGRDSTALGQGAKSTVDGSVALGKGTVAGREAGKVGYIASAGDMTFDAVLTALGKKADYDNWKATNKLLIEKYNELTKAYLKADERDKAAKKKALDDLNEWKQKNGNFIDELTKKEKLEATWKASRGAVSVGGESEDEAGNKIIATRQITNVAAGSEDTDAVNVAQLKALNTKVDKGAIHYFSVNSTDKGADSNWKNDGATGVGAVAIGVGAQAQGKYSIALGDQAQVLKDSSMALGQGAQALGESSTALGVGANANGESSTALGQGATADGESSTALGHGASADRESSTALGYFSNAEGESSMALGRRAKAQGKFSMALGYFSGAQGESSTALGREAKAQGKFSMALGYFSGAQGESSTALGRRAKALVDGSVALGEGTVAGRAAGTVGYVASAGDTTFDAVLTALDKKADYDKWKATNKSLIEKYNELTKAYLKADERDKAAKKKALDDLNEWKQKNGNFIDALMKNEKLEATWRATKAAVSVGADGVDEAGNGIIATRQITNVAAGSEDTDAVNVAQLKALNTKVDKGAVHYFSVKSTEKGENSNRDNDGATGEDAVAIGVGAQAKGGASTALGLGVIAEKDSSTAVGCSAYAQGDFSTALGYKANAQGNLSTALGQGAQALEVSSTALGSGAKALLDGSVALGFGSIASIDKGVVGYDPFIGQASTETSAIWKATHAAFSVGSTVDGNYLITRQITGVAAGTQDTDAVNVAQLKALNMKVDGKKDIHFFSSNGSGSDINYDNQGARAIFTTAIGPDAMATEENSQAFGYRARAIGHSSIVFGVESTASGARDIAIGYGSHAVGSDNTNTSWDDTIAIGWDALSRGGSFASGSGAVAGGSGSVALGFGAYVGTKWLDDETQKAQNVNKWVLTQSFLDNGLRDELKAKFPEKFAEWERRAKNMPAAMGSEYLEQKLRTLAMEQLPQMTSPSMKNNMKDMDSSIAIGHGARVYSASAIAIGSKAKVGENLDDAIALGNQSLATRNAGGFGYDPTSDATTWIDFKKAHPEIGVGAAREQEITRELNNIEVEMKKMGNEYAAWSDKAQHYDNYKEERKAYAKAHGSTLDSNNEWVEWVAHVRNEQQKLRNKGQVLYNKFSALQKELNSGKGAWVGGKAALAIGNEEAGVTRQITGVAAGTKDTDAVNVAQLKVLNTKVDKVAANSTAYTVETKENDDNTTTVTIKSNKAGDKGTTVTVATKDIHITSGTYDKNTKKLTFTTNTNTTFDVDMNDVINAAAEGSVHYLSVNSSEQGAGSNYKNDGAKGVHAVAIGAYATADSVGGVSLGRDSTAKREGGLFGYNPKNGSAFVDGTAVAEYLGKTTEYDALQTEMTAKKTAVEEAKAALKDNPTDTTKKENLNKAYQALEEVQQKENLLLGAYRSASGYGAFSVGNEEKGITRQITGVAAGTKDTDAVNVAQLKVLNTKVDKVAANSTAYTVETKENNDNTTTVTIKSNKAGDKGTTVTVATKDIHITSGTYDKNTKKLTFTTNTNTTFDVDMNDVINAAAEGSVHYLSVNSSEQGAGSNYKNDGAKAKDSIVLGVRSSSEGINGVVVGNDNKLTGIKNNQNNSVVIGTGLNVDGVHNIVVGTNYENYDQKETKVKGEQNTVIGNGNLVGYTAVKDPNDDRKWIYTAGDGSDQNVVVGMCNTANGGSIAVGSDLEVEDRGRAFGSGNKIIGSDNRGGQWGLALGSNNTVKGEKAVSVGTDTNALGDYTVSIGSEAKTNASQSIAMGYQAETGKGWSAAIGSGAKTEGEASTAVGGFSASATVDYGAAFGSFSVAQRASGVAGYLANGQTGSAWISSLGAFSVGDDVTGYSRQITGVAAGSEDTDAVNVAQLKALEKKLFKVLPEVVGDQKTGVVVEKNPKENTSTSSTSVTTPPTGVTTTAPAAENKTVYKVKLDKKIDVGHISIDGTENKETVVVGDVKINGEKGHGTVTGLSNTTWDEKHVVSGRAATEDQLQAVSKKNQQAISELGTQLERGTASAAALAALHPQEFDPADKWDFAVGYSNYRSANTFAFGGFYRPNERTLVSLGGTFGGENIVNVGLSFKTGKGSDGISTSRVAMAREIQELKLQNKQQEEKSQQLKQDNQAIRKENQEMKKEVEWLKRQVAKLLTK